MGGEFQRASEGAGPARSAAAPPPPPPGQHCVPPRRASEASYWGKGNCSAGQRGLEAEPRAGQARQGLTVSLAAPPLGEKQWLVGGRLQPRGGRRLWVGVPGTQPQGWAWESRRAPGLQAWAGGPKAVRRGRSGERVLLPWQWG